MVQPSAEVYETLFHAAELELLVPDVSALSPLPTADSSPETRQWWTSVQTAESRDVAFLDEKITYFVALSLPESALADLPSTSSRTDPPGELVRFLSHLQLTMTASLLPPLTAKRPLPASARSTSQTPSASLAPPPTTDPSTPRPSQAGLDPMRRAEDALLPITPNPFPNMKDAEADYAAVDGVTAWEGKVGLDGEHGPEGSRWIVRRENDEGWDVVWQGEVPIAYVRTSIQNPLLGLTASMTFREGAAARHTHSKGFSIDSTISVAETELPDAADQPGGASGFELATMEEIDLLGGLDGAAKVPASRLPNAIRQDLSLPPISAAQPSSAFSPPTSTPTARDQAVFASQTASTLRKSYRRVLSLSSGLRVRMRTLFLPEFIPPTSTANGSTGIPEAGHADTESEKKVVLVVEVENPLDSAFASAFEVESVKVDISGKGSPMSASLVRTAATSEAEVFPIRLEAVEQYNLLYRVDIVSLDAGVRAAQHDPQPVGPNSEHRPVVIVVTGRPYEADPAGKVRYPTHSFQSRWNCTLDVGPFFASLAAKSAASPLQAGPDRRPHTGKHSKTVQDQEGTAPVNAIVGDKRYSLASLASQNSIASGSSGIGSGSTEQQVRNRLSSGTQKPLPPGPIPGMRGASRQGTTQPAADHGLLLSVRLLPSHSSAATEPASPVIRPLEPFSIEVFVQNRTDEVRRFRLSVPGRLDWADRLWAAWIQRRPRKVDEPFWGAEESVLRQSLAAHQSNSLGLVPLENDIRCGPLLPGASMSARIKFMALREGLHTIDQLRVVGVGDNYESIMSPVLDVLVDKANAQMV